MIDTNDPEFNLVSLSSVGIASPESSVDKVVQNNASGGPKSLRNTNASTMGIKTMNFNSTASKAS